ncbi:hypothetical protein D3C79_997300 [compost metagenome]
MRKPKAEAKPLLARISLSVTMVPRSCTRVILSPWSIEVIGVCSYRVTLAGRLSARPLTSADGCSSRVPGMCRAFL